MFQSHEAHKKILKKSEFDIAPARFWMQVIEVGALQSHLLGSQVQLVGKEISRGMGVGTKL